MSDWQIYPAGNASPPGTARVHFLVPVASWSETSWYVREYVSGICWVTKRVQNERTQVYRFDNLEDAKALTETLWAFRP
jgi:hypothetical protein